MLPAINIPPLELLGVVFKPFHLLILAAVVGGHHLGLRRARKTGLDQKIMADGNILCMATGFVGAHLVALIFYHPERILEDPLILLAIWNGMSSFGGLIGAYWGARVYYRRKGTSLTTYADAKIFGFVPVWMIGRLGCTITFDHPGTPTNFLLGMSDKKGMLKGHFGLYRDGIVRHNLGFYELLLTAGLTAVLHFTGGYQPFPLFHCALMLLLYCPARFGFDFLRVRDRLYLGLTPGQYLALAGLGIAAYLIHLGRSAQARAAATEEKHVPTE